MNRKSRRSRRQRKRSNLTRKLVAYSIATGAGSLLASDASAVNIEYTPLGAPIVLDAAFSETFSIDIDGDLTIDFELLVNDEYGPVLASLYPSAGNFVLPDDLFFPTGAGVVSPFGTIGADTTDWLGDSFNDVGLQLFTGIRGFVGVSFEGGSTHFGFLDIELDTTAGTLTLYGGGYESVAGAPATAVPEPGCLGLLAIGSAGLLSWRGARSRSKIDS